MEVCAECLTNTINRQWECLCSYWNWPILEIDKRTLKQIHSLQEKWFEIKLKKGKQVYKLNN